MTDENPQGMTIDEYDVAVFKSQEAEKLRHHQAVEDEKKRRHVRSVERLKTIGVVFGSVAGAAAVVGIAFIVWLGVRGPSADAVLEQEVKLECTKAGGTWLDVSAGSSDTTSGTCFGPAIKVEK